MEPGYRRSLYKLATGRIRRGLSAAWPTQLYVPGYLARVPVATRYSARADSHVKACLIFSFWAPSSLPRHIVSQIVHRPS